MQPEEAISAFLDGYFNTEYDEENDLAAVANSDAYDVVFEQSKINSDEQAVDDVAESGQEGSYGSFE